MVGISASALNNGAVFMYSILIVLVTSASDENSTPVKKVQADNWLVYSVGNNILNSLFGTKFLVTSLASGAVMSSAVIRCRSVGSAVAKVFVPATTELA
jgi:hypothetical protein